MEYQSLLRQLVSHISGRIVLDVSGKENCVKNQAQDQGMQHPAQQRRLSGTRQQRDERNQYTCI